MSLLIPAQTDDIFWRGELVGAKNVTDDVRLFFPEQTICYQHWSNFYTT